MSLLSDILPHDSIEDFESCVDRLRSLAVERQKALQSLPTTAHPEELAVAAQRLPKGAPDEGWGLTKSVQFMLEEMAPLLNPGQIGPRYFGFVTGGVTPSALLADWFTTLYDQNVQVHLPKETLSTVIEAFTVQMLLQLFRLPKDSFTGTLTTGATSSNLLALICAREETMKRCMYRKYGVEDWSSAEYGTSSAIPIKVFVSQAHASIRKTAALAGIGRANVLDVGQRTSESMSNKSSNQDDVNGDHVIRKRMQCLDFDLIRLEKELANCFERNEAAIVVLGMGEVVTGALCGQTQQVKELCTRYEAWLHMDAAFSALVCLIEGYGWISRDMVLCDSITSDGHKSFNVPYDCGIFLVKKQKQSQISILDQVCGPGSSGGPAYLAATPSKAEDEEEEEDAHFISSIPSPLNRNLENSRRFRALPLYINLLSHGVRGMQSMTQRNLHFAARLRAWIDECPHYQLLTLPCPELDPTRLLQPQPWKGHWNTTVIFFRAHPLSCPVDAFRHNHLALIQAIKNTRKMYVSPGGLDGIGGVRIAVSNWSTELESDEDFRIVTSVLLQVMSM